MPTLYEDNDIIIKLHNGRFYAGYKGDEIYKVHHGGITADEFDEGKWELTYKKGAKIFTDFERENTGIYAGAWVDGGWYHDCRDGRFVNDDGETMYSAMLGKVNDQGWYTRLFLLGFTREAPTE